MLIKPIVCVFFMLFSLIMGAISPASTNFLPAAGVEAQGAPNTLPPPMQEPIGMPPRKDVFAYNSPFAKAKLQRAEYILSTLVKNPSDYQLIISSKTSFGGEAVPPFVYSDKPTMIIYQGAISPNRSDEEIAFMMAHELGHLTLQHMQRMDHQMGELMAGPPLGISGTTFAVFHVKLQEREADMFGLNLYKKSGYSLSFFPHTLQILEYNPNLHFGSNKIFRKELSSLSMKDSHFSMKERFELLVSEAQHMA